MHVVLAAAVTTACENARTHAQFTWLTSPGLVHRARACTHSAAAARSAYARARLSSDSDRSSWAWIAPAITAQAPRVMLKSLQSALVSMSDGASQRRADLLREPARLHDAGPLLAVLPRAQQWQLLLLTVAALQLPHAATLYARLEQAGLLPSEVGQTAALMRRRVRHFPATVSGVDIHGASIR
jgi:hypothetical protein